MIFRLTQTGRNLWWKPTTELWHVRCGNALVLAITLEISGVLALGQTLAAGYSKYTAGDFRSAEASLKAASRTKVSSSQKAKIFKYLGISQYMLNKKRDAAISFKAALKLDPRISVSKSEVLDEGVIPLFTTVKGQRSQQPPSPPVARPNRSSGATVALAAGKGSPKRTTLIVNSNIPGTILIDGILAGTTGQTLNTDPGVVELTIQPKTKGYLTKRARVRVIANRANSVSTTLSKPAPKPAPQRRSAYGGRFSSQQAQPRSPAQQQPYLPDPSSELPPADTYADPALMGRDLAGEFAADSAGGGYAAPAPAPAYQQPPYAQPGYPPQQPAYPAYPQQPYGYPQQPYGPAYPQYPPAQQPYYPPAQPAPAPAPMPAAPVLPPAEPEPLPPVDDVFDDSSNKGSDFDRSFDDDFMGDPVKKKKRRKRFKKPKRKRFKKQPRRYSQLRKRKKRRKKRSSSPDTGTVLIALLPFGAGQFQNESYILGGLFLAAEAGALYYWYDNKTQADEAITTAEEFFNSDASAEEKEQFEEETRTFVAEKRQQQQIGIYSFAGLYVLGVGEAFLNMPSGKPKRKRRKRRRRVENNHDPLRNSVLSVLAQTGSDPSIDRDTFQTVESETGMRLKNSSQPVLSFGMMLDKQASPTRIDPDPKFGLHVEWEF